MVAIWLKPEAAIREPFHPNRESSVLEPILLPLQAVFPTHTLHLGGPPKYIWWPILTFYSIHSIHFFFVFFCLILRMFSSNFVRLLWCHSQLVDFDQLDKQQHAHAAGVSPAVMTTESWVEKVLKVRSTQTFYGKNCASIPIYKTPQKKL